jgi:hypothetical protein
VSTTCPDSEIASTGYATIPYWFTIANDYVLRTELHLFERLLQEITAKRYCIINCSNVLFSDYMPLYHYGVKYSRSVNIGSLRQRSNDIIQAKTYFRASSYYCQDCWMIRPLRSKHCDQCEMCVTKYSNQSIFLNWCWQLIAISKLLSQFSFFQCFHVSAITWVACFQNIIVFHQRGSVATMHWSCLFI